MQTIVFSDIKRRTIGTVVFDGVGLTADTPFAQSMVDHTQKKGLTPEKFVEKFTGWSNGYTFSELETD